MPTINPLNILSNGLPATGAPGRHIAIIGAGAAGLAAGMLLKQAGHRVTILEARNRLGGRIYTYRGFALGLFGELGAMRFPRQHQLVQHLITRYKLPTSPFAIYDADTFIYLNGKGVRRSQFTAETFNFELLPAERGKLPADILRAAVQPLIDTIEAPGGWARLVQNYDRYSLIAYLKERGLSDAALAMIGPLLNLEGRYHLSLVEWLSHYHEDVFGDLVYLTGGADALPNAMAASLLGDIRLGAEVQAVRQSTSGVVVAFKDSTGYSHSITADECILTVPFILIRNMDLQGLDPAKRFALRNVYYDRAHKIFMQFSQRWWQTKYQITCGVTSTDLPIRNVVYTPAGQDAHSQRGVLIASYAWGQDSMAFSMLSEQERLSQTLQSLAKIHPEARLTFEAGVSYDWALDPYAGGIGPIFRPFEMNSAAFEEIARPVERIWFANDACDRRHRRWVEASLIAAVRAAFAIHTGMYNRLPAIENG
jgi:monoamine oxidase